MRRFLCVALVLISAALLPEAGFGQGVGGPDGVQEPQDSIFYLGRNYPNPFNSETRIPFDLYEGAFPDGRAAVVDIRIYNAIRQYVASPTALGHPAGDGTPVVELEYLSPGHYESHWDGRDSSGTPVANGTYILELIVNGRPRSRLMFVGN